MTQIHSAEIIDLIQPALLEDPEFLRGLLQSMLQKLVNGQFAQHRIYNAKYVSAVPL